MMSVVIPVSPDKVGRALNNCLASLEWQATDDFEVLLVVLYPKGASFKEWPALTQRLSGLGGRLLQHRAPYRIWGPSLSRNVGLREAQGSILATLDADALLPRTALASALELAEGGLCVRCPTRMRPEGPGQSLFSTPEGVLEASKAGPLGSGPGCLLVTPRAAVEAVRGWDEAYWGYGPTDWDFVLRVEQAGWTWEEGPHVVHQNHTRDEKALRPFIRKNRLLYARTKSGKLTPARNPGAWGGR